MSSTDPTAVTDLYPTGAPAGLRTAAEPLSARKTAPRSLKGLAIQGSVWTFVGFGTARVLRLGSNVVLAALLFPEAFGLLALVYILINGLKMFSDIGIRTSIIRDERGDDPRFLNTAWTMQVGRGVILWLCACLLAWPFAAMYGESQLLRLIPVAGLTALIGGFSSTSLATASRHLSLGRLTVLEILVQVVSILVAIIGAWVWQSVWAIVIGVLAGVAAKVLLSHTWLAERHNRFAWDPSAARSLVRFGKWIFLSTALTFLAFQADRLLLGKLVPLDVLGVYSIAWVLMKVPTDVGVRLTHRVLFPALSKLNRIHPDTLSDKFQLARRMILSVGLFIYLGVTLLAPSFFQLLYDDRYHNAGWMAQLLAIPVWFSLLRSTGSPALLAVGDSRSMAVSTLINLVITVTGCLVGFLLYDLVGFMLGLAAGSLAGYMAVVIALARRGFSIYRQDLFFTGLVGGLAGIGLTLPRLLGSYGSIGSKLALDLIAAGLVLVFAGCVAAWCIHRSLTAAQSPTRSR